MVALRGIQGLHDRRHAVELFLVALFLIPTSALAGKNGGGALIVHTNDSVNYTPNGDYCGTLFNDPGSCENAITRTDKDEDHAAVIWVLAAFPADSSPAVTAVQFGLNHNIPEDHWETWHACGPGVLEIPDNGWPATGKGTAIAFNTPVTERLFPIYWVAVYGFSQPDTAYIGTGPYHPGAEQAQFADDSTPPALDDIARFGRVRWYSEGSNVCPSITIEPRNILTNTPEWTALISDVPKSEIDVVLRVDNNNIYPTTEEVTGPLSSLWTFPLESLEPSADVSVNIHTRGGVAWEIPLQVKQTQRVSVTPGAVSVDLQKGTLSWTPTRCADPAGCIRNITEVPCHDSVFCQTLAMLGVTKIRKMIADAADGDSIWTANNGTSERIPPRSRSTYTLYFPEASSPQAIAEILRTRSVVLSASPAAQIELKTDPCPAQDAFYNSQWYLKTAAETDSCSGLAADYTWCVSTGRGLRIYVVDTPVNPSHPDLIGRVVMRAGSWPPHYNEGAEWLNHGSMVAVLATGGHTSGNEYAGASAADTVYSVPFYRTSTADDIVDAIRYVDTAATGRFAIMTCAWALGSWTQGQYDAIWQLAYSLKSKNILFLAATDNPPPFGNNDPYEIPAAMEPVYSVSGYLGNGNGNGVRADSIRTAAPTINPGISYFGIDGNFAWAPGNSQATALAAGAASLIAGCAQLDLSSPLAVHYIGGLLVSHSDQSPGDTIDSNIVCGLVPIQDVTNVHAVGGDHVVTVGWTLTDAEGVAGFSILEAPSCWGPFETAVGWIECTGAGDYTRVLAAPYAREYYFKVVAWGGGSSARYNCDAEPSVGGTFESIDTASNVEFIARPPRGGLLRWTKAQSLYYHLYYEVFRSAGGPMSDCGWDKKWGNWDHGSVDSDVVSCTDPPLSGSACWYDDDLVPGVPYTYRLGTFGRDAQGRIVCMAALSTPVVGYSLPTADASDEASAPNFAVRINPVPQRIGGTIGVELSSRISRMVHFTLYDVGGRGIALDQKDLAIRAGKTVVGINPLRRLAGGLYFLALETGDEQRRIRRVVVVP